MNMGISERIIKIIKENNISVSEISKSTGIEQKKLTDEQTIFSAKELLELCDYLNIQPNNIS